MSPLRAHQAALETQVLQLTICVEKLSRHAEAAENRGHMQKSLLARLDEHLRRTPKRTGPAPGSAQTAGAFQSSSLGHHMHEAGPIDAAHSRSRAVGPCPSALDHDTSHAAADAGRHPCAA